MMPRKGTREDVEGGFGLGVVSGCEDEWLVDAVLGFDAEAFQADPLDAHVLYRHEQEARVIQQEGAAA